MLAPAAITMLDALEPVRSFLERGMIQRHAGVAQARDGKMRAVDEIDAPKSRPTSIQLLAFEDQRHAAIDGRLSPLAPRTIDGALEANQRAHGRTRAFEI